MNPNMNNMNPQTSEVKSHIGENMKEYNTATMIDTNYTGPQQQVVVQAQPAQVQQQVVTQAQPQQVVVQAQPAQPQAPAIPQVPQQVVTQTQPAEEATA